MSRTALLICTYSLASAFLLNAGDPVIRLGVEIAGKRYFQISREQPACSDSATCIAVTSRDIAAVGVLALVIVVALIYLYRRSSRHARAMGVSRGMAQHSLAHPGFCRRSFARLARTALHLVFLNWLLTHEEVDYNAENDIAQPSDMYLNGLNSDYLFAVVTLTSPRPSSCPTDDSHPNCWDWAMFLPDPELEPQGSFGTLFRALPTPVTRSIPYKPDWDFGNYVEATTALSGAMPTATSKPDDAFLEEATYWGIQQELQGVLELPDVLAIVPLGDVSHMLTYEDMVGSEPYYSGFLRETLNDMFARDIEYDGLFPISDTKQARIWVARAAIELTEAGLLSCGSWQEAHLRLLEDLERFGREGARTRKEKGPNVQWYEFFKLPEVCNLAPAENNGSFVLDSGPE